MVTPTATTNPASPPSTLLETISYQDASVAVNAHSTAKPDQTLAEVHEKVKALALRCKELSNDVLHCSIVPTKHSPERTADHSPTTDRDQGALTAEAHLRIIRAQSSFAESMQAAIDDVEEHVRRSLLGDDAGDRTDTPRKSPTMPSV